MADQHTKWNSKKGRHESYTFNDNGVEVTMGFQTSGNKPSNEQVLYKYADYLGEAIDAAAKAAKKGDKLEVNPYEYNLKNFIENDLGNHYSSFQVKAILRSYNDAQEDSGKIHVMAVGPMGRKANTEARNNRVAEYLAKKHKSIVGKTF